ncbi:MAG: ABC transporter permease [Bryobacteraceae bacterium]|jgi:predicted permease
MWWQRIANMFRGERLRREIDEELASHIAEAVAQGRAPAEARGAFGSPLARREESRDIRMIPWLDSLRADAIFGWRQLLKRKVSTAAAVLSLALGIGACTSAFRLIDAVLLRPLPVAEPDRLYGLFRQSVDFDGNRRIDDSYEYPLFRQMRAAVKPQAELIAVSYTGRADLTYGSDEEMEKAYVQNVSGWMFTSLGLRPAAGRLLTANDDVTPGAHPYVVISYDYWRRRFGLDPKAVGRTFRADMGIFEVVGVGPESFTGTEPGTITDIFIPMAMHAGVTHPTWSWFRVLVRLRNGVAAEPVFEKLRATYHAVNQERAKEFTGMPQRYIDRFFRQTLLMEHAAAGISDMQKEYRRALAALAALVALVLLIACANVANLMTAQAAARAREMALRVAIGAGRGRLVQLVMVEGAMLGILAAVAGWLFAWWSAPFVAGRINPPDNPARLVLAPDWRVAAFGLALTLGVVLLFGLAPALRASSVKPANSLKGGDDPHSRRRLMHALIAAQVAFCFLVLFVAGLFAVTLRRLANQPTGFSAERIVNLDTLSPRQQPMAFWDEVTERLRALPGVETVALAGWPLLNGNGWNGVVSIGGARPAGDLAYFLNVSPGWADTLKIPFIDGRDFRQTDKFPGVAIVNQAFARRYFDGADPVGKLFEKVEGDGARTRFQIVGWLRDARYRNMREPITPTAYVPIYSQPRSSATFIVRTAAPNPAAMAPILRREVPRARPEFRVTNIRTQVEINQSHTVRERLLALLAVFFAMVALLLAGIGLYGVLEYSVVERQREIGIRVAIGAPAGNIARLVTVEIFAMVLAGALAGLALAMASARYIEGLLYQVKPTAAGFLALPSITILAAALLAALPAVIHAVRIDPARMLRAD